MVAVDGVITTNTFLLAMCYVAGIVLKVKKVSGMQISIMTSQGPECLMFIISSSFSEKLYTSFNILKWFLHFDCSIMIVIVKCQ